MLWWGYVKLRVEQRIVGCSKLATLPRSAHRILQGLWNSGSQLQIAQRSTGSRLTWSPASGLHRCHHAWSGAAGSLKLGVPGHCGVYDTLWCVPEKLLTIQPEGP